LRQNGSIQFDAAPWTILRLPNDRPYNLRLTNAAWRNGLNFPIYVPEELTGISHLLSNGRVAETCSELRRLAALGSDHAAALLAYMCVRGISLTAGNHEGVLLRCQEAAARGNNYAQYVMAVTCRIRGDYKTEWGWLNMATKNNFGPALAESGQLAAGAAHEYDIANLFFRRGMRTGHIPSLIYYLSWCYRGKYGIARRLSGALLFPLAAVLMQVIAWYAPYSLSIFVHVYGSNKQLYKDPQNQRP
jgi:hypothetical protein